MVAPILDNVDAALLFKTLYSRVPKDSGAWFEGRLVSLDGEEAKHFGFTTASDLIGFASTRADVSDGWHTYFAVCLRSENRMKSEAVLVPALWVDADGAEWQEKLNAIPLPPTIVVSSGKGAHAYWVLSTPTIPSDKVKEALTGLAEMAFESSECTDFERLLRVPGTLNIKYDPPQISRVVSANGPLYSLDDLLAITRVSRKVINKIRSGDARGYKSRSERDWAVIFALLGAGMTTDAVKIIFEHNTIGDKFHSPPPEGGDHYLEFTINKALERLEKAALFGFQSRDDGLWIDDGKNTRQVATFVFKPRALLVPDDPQRVQSVDVLLGEMSASGETWRNVTLTKRAFGGVRALLEELPAASWQWLGTDKEVRMWLPYLMQQLRSQPEGLIMMRAVNSVGRHGSTWVSGDSVITSDSVVSPEEAGIVYLSSGRESPGVKYPKVSDLEYRELLESFTSMIELVNETHVIWPILCWTAATPYKPYLESCGIRFPILNLYGTRGSGKTSTAVDLILPLCGYVYPVGYDCSTTPFVLLSLLASTNAVPVAFSEFRRSSMTESAYEMFTRLLLLLYDVGKEARGRPDQTTVSYPLTAPVVIDGEDPLRDPAILERAIPVRMRPEAIREGTVCTKAFERVTKLPLHKLSTKYIQFTLSAEPPIDLLRERLFAAFPTAVPNRVRTNMLVLLVGLWSLTEFWSQQGVSKSRIPKITVEFIQEMLAPILMDLVGTGSGRTRILVDDFVEDVVNAASTGQKYFTYRYDPREKVLWVHVSTAVSWWLAQRKRQGLGSLNKRAIMVQLEERLGDEGGTNELGQYVVARKRVSIGGSTFWAFGVSLPDASEFGLDVPDNMLLRTVVLHLTPEDDDD